jgi:hypothetical protein
MTQKGREFTEALKSPRWQFTSGESTEILASEGITICLLTSQRPGPLCVCVCVCVCVGMGELEFELRALLLQSRHYAS